MKKIYILDTNILIQSPNAVECFENNDVILPISVIEELDSLKNADGEKGANARRAIRFIEQYRKILVTRPNVQFDNDIGFLPGSEQDKISPLMRPIIDNLEQLVDSNENERYDDEVALRGKIEEMFDRGIIVAEAMNYIRGRSFVQTYLIIDEAQNMTPRQVTGIITRAGKGTKVILLGDPKQIDNPFLDEKTNGLSYASERMKGSSLCYQITLSTEECERSSLAMDAIERM